MLGSFNDDMVRNVTNHLSSALNAVVPGRVKKKSYDRIFFFNFLFFDVKQRTDMTF